MALKIPSVYQLKKALMYPRTVYMRRKENFEPGFMRSAMELHYYRPAFYNWLRARAADEHLLHEADIDENSLVLDIGAYTGEWAQEVLSRYNPTVHAFEPDPRNYRQLEKKARENPRLIAYNYGLGEKTETARMSLDYLGSSVYASPGEKNHSNWAEVELKDILAIWKSLSLDRVDFMKINIEGGEFPLLERMIETDLIKRVDCFLIQFHEWHPGAYGRRRKIHKAMSKTHRLEWDYHFVWEKWLLK